MGSNWSAVQEHLGTPSAVNNSSECDPTIVQFAQSLRKRLSLPRRIPSPFDSPDSQIPSSTLPYSKHLGPARWAHTLSCWPPILHGYALSVPHLSFGAALHTVCLHQSTSMLVRMTEHSLRKCQQSRQIAPNNEWLSMVARRKCFWSAMTLQKDFFLATFTLGASSRPDIITGLAIGGQVISPPLWRERGPAGLGCCALWPEGLGPRELLVMLVNSRRVSNLWDCKGSLTVGCYGHIMGTKRDGNRNCLIEIR
jgi:hypothetical protein